jgi:methionine-rich copper-binding protein CopC
MPRPSRIAGVPRPSRIAGVPRRSRIVGCVAAALAVALVAWFAARPRAQPHAGLTSSYPADQATLAQPPAEIDLTFTSPVELNLSHVSIVDGSGLTVTAGRPRLVTPERLRQQVRATDAGELTVAYHVTFVNRAELDGVIRFNVGNEAAEQGVAAGRPSAGPAENAAAEANHQHGVDPVSAVLLVLDGLVAICVILLLRLRPRLPDRPVATNPPAHRDRVP